MATIKQIKDALKNLDESKEVRIYSPFYGKDVNNPIEIELIKEIKEQGQEYYIIKI